MTIYSHRCGQRYVRTSQATPPRVCLIICERCLEPMPLCDDSRAAFTYEPIDGAAFRQLMATERAATAPSTKRPMLKQSSVTPLFATRTLRQDASSRPL